jgi:hypothetical protein
MVTTGDQDKVTTRTDSRHVYRSRQTNAELDVRRCRLCWRDGFGGVPHVDMNARQCTPEVFLSFIFHAYEIRD